MNDLLDLEEGGLLERQSFLKSRWRDGNAFAITRGGFVVAGYVLVHEAAGEEKRDP